MDAYDAGKRSMRLRWLAAAGAILVPAIVAAALLWPPPPSSFDATYSFEEDMEGWTAGSADLAWGNCSAGAQSEGPLMPLSGNCTISASIDRSTGLARQGAASVRLFMDNLNDMGKIWIERAFNVTPGRTYRVHLAFAFASSDYGAVNHWRIVAGVLTARPSSSDDLTPAYREDTGNGLAAAGGYVWLVKAYDVTVTAHADGRLWALVGVWGTWEGPRAYYVDVVHVTILSA